MNWASVIANPYLQNLPFKIRLNKWGIDPIIGYSYETRF